MSKDQTIEQVSAKTLNAKIDGLAKKHGAWRDEVQTVLVLCARNAFDHGNVDGFTRVVNVLKGADMKAIMLWAKTYAPTTYHKQENKFTLNKAFKGDSEGGFDEEFLLGQKWWDKATEAKDVVTEFDVLEAVQAMIKRAEREVTAKVNIKTIKNLELLKDVRRTVTQYEESMKPQVITIEVDDDAEFAEVTSKVKLLANKAA